MTTKLMRFGWPLVLPLAITLTASTARADNKAAPHTKTATMSIAANTGPTASGSDVSHSIHDWHPGGAATKQNTGMMGKHMRHVVSAR